MPDTYSAKFLRAVNFVDFAVFLQHAKIITVKMNGRLVTWLKIMLAIYEIKILSNLRNL